MGKKSLFQKEGDCSLSLFFLDGCCPLLLLGLNRLAFMTVSGRFGKMLDLESSF